MSRYKFRLLAGQHIQADHKQKPTTVTDPATGKTTEKYPSKTYKAGDIVECDTNLATRFGAEKFELLSGDSLYHAAGDTASEIAAASQSVAPGGQVSSGYQVTSGEGKSGPMTQEQIEGLTGKEQPKMHPTLQGNQPRPMQKPK